VILRALLYCIGVFVLMAVVAVVIGGIIKLLYAIMNRSNGKSKEEVKQVTQ